MHYVLIGEQLGILGHPLEIYDASLNLNMRKFKKMGWNADYDPYGFIRPVTLELPSIEKTSNLAINPQKFIFRKNQESSLEMFDMWRKKEFLIKAEMKERNPVIVNLD